MQRRLARAGGAHDRREGAGREADGDAAERVDGGGALAEAARQLVAPDDLRRRGVDGVGGGEAQLMPKALRCDAPGHRPDAPAPLRPTTVTDGGAQRMATAPPGETIVATPTRRRP